MAIIRVVRNAVNFREFQTDPVTHVYYHNTCGETALAAAMVAATPQMESTAQAIDLMTSLTREMMSLGWADKPQGATTTRRLYSEAARRGFEIASPFVGWQDPIPSSTLHPWLLQYAGIMPIVLMVTHAGEGLTAIDGSHAERGVQGHFITILGLADEGYVTEDGDNNQIANHLVIYPWAAIEKAHVTGFLMLKLQEVATVGAPKNWTDNPTTKELTAKNGVKVISGFRDKIMTWPGGWPENNVPRGPEYQKTAAQGGIEPGNPKIGAGSRQDFVGAGDDKNLAGVVSLGWTESMGVYVIWAGQDMGVYEKQLKDQADQIAALKAGQASGQMKADHDAMNAVRTALGTH